MKEIKAYIREHLLTHVIEELHKIEGLTGVSVTEVKGYGRIRKKGVPVRIVDTEGNWTRHVKLEIFCQDELAEQIITAIQSKAHTGLRSDGKIYISNVEEAIRISTNERGEKAI